MWYGWRGGSYSLNSVPIFQPTVHSDRYVKMHFSLSQNDVRAMKGILCQLSWNQILSFSRATVSTYWRDLPNNPLMRCISTRFVCGDWACKGKSHVADIRHSYSFTPQKSVWRASRQLNVRKTTVLKVAWKALVSLHISCTKCSNWHSQTKVANDDTVVNSRSSRESFVCERDTLKEGLRLVILCRIESERNLHLCMLMDYLMPQLQENFS
jgi:hypothetical protein